MTVAGRGLGSDGGWSKLIGVGCNTPHLGDALRANLGLKVGIILFYQELKVDFLLDLNFCFDFGTVT